MRTQFASRRSANKVQQPGECEQSKVREVSLSPRRVGKKIGTPTRDVLIFWSKRRDSNPRSPVPETGAIPPSLRLDVFIYPNIITQETRFVKWFWKKTLFCAQVAFLCRTGGVLGYKNGWRVSVLADFAAVFLPFVAFWRLPAQARAFARGY